MFDETLPVEIGLQEFRLNLTEQYSPGLAFLLIDIPIMIATQEVAMKSMEKLSEALLK